MIQRTDLQNFTDTVSHVSENNNLISPEVYRWPLHGEDVYKSQLNTLETWLWTTNMGSSHLSSRETRLVEQNVEKDFLTELLSNHQQVR